MTTRHEHTADGGGGRARSAATWRRTSARIGPLIAQARERGVRLLALPEACLGGYLRDAGRRSGGAAPRRCDPDGPEIRRLAALAGDLVVTRRVLRGPADDRYNSVVCVTGDGVLGHHRKVHQPLREDASYARGEPVRRVRHPGRAAGHDDLLRQGVPGVGPDARPGRRRDRGLRVGVAGQPDQPGRRSGPGPVDPAVRPVRPGPGAGEPDRVGVGQPVGDVRQLRFVASAKVVDPGGDVLASTGTAAGMAVAELDVAAALDGARRSMAHLRDRRPQAYGLRRRPDRMAPIGSPRRPRTSAATWTSTCAGWRRSSSTPGRPGPRCWCCRTRRSAAT